MQLKKILKTFPLTVPAYQTILIELWSEKVNTDSYTHGFSYNIIQHNKKYQSFKQNTTKLFLIAQNYKHPKIGLPLVVHTCV